MNMELSMQDFCKKVKTALQNELEENRVVRISEVPKNNGIVLHGVSIFEPGVNITPTIYLEEYLKRYNEGETLAALIREIKSILRRNAMDESFDISLFTDLEKAKRRIVYKLVNVPKNQNLLKEVPYIPYLDMAIVFYYLLEDQEVGGYATILIQKTHLKHWDINVQELYSYAIANTERLLPPVMENLEEMMHDILRQEFGDFKKKKNPWNPEWPEEVSVDDLLEDVLGERHGVPMYVLTNKYRYYGAACILYPNLLKKIYEELHCSFYILPSSIHEVIILPDLGIEAEDNMLDMVREVNETEVKAQEVLSDSIYYYQVDQEGLRILQKEECVTQ